VAPDAASDAHDMTVYRCPSSPNWPTVYSVFVWKGAWWKAGRRCCAKAARLNPAAEAMPSAKEFIDDVTQVA
jgi:hypothetical protein